MERQATPSQATDARPSLVPGFSMEMTANNIQALKDAAPFIPQGTAISVTFLPTEKYPDRIRAVQTVRELGYVPVPHLSARRIKSEAEVDEYLGTLVETAQVDHVFIVGGDPKPSEAAGPYRDALTLISSGILKRHGIKRAGITGYPDGHPDITNEQLKEAMMAKLQSLREQNIESFIMTQFGFEADSMLAWLKELGARGVDCQIRLGVPGPAKIRTLLSYAKHCGVATTTRGIGRYGLSLTRLLNTVGPSALIEDLEAGVQSVPGADVALHFYTFGGLKNTAEWIKNYSEKRNA